MCQSQTPAAQPPEDARTFDSVEAFLDVIQPGMHLCTSDFTGWAVVEAVRPATAGKPARVRGRRQTDGRAVEVPATELIDLRGGHCVRVDRVRATIDAQGWEVGAPAVPR